MKKALFSAILMLTIVTLTHAQLQVTISGDPQFCQGSQTTINAVATGGTPPYNYTWSNGVNTQSTNITIAGMYSVTVTDMIGDTVSAHTHIIMNPTPAATITPANANVCFGECTSITASCNQGFCTYFWSPGLLTGNPVTVCPTGTTTYTLTMNNNGCTATQCITITVTPNPIVNAQVSPAMICAGDTAFLSATGTATYYTWNTSWTGGVQGAVMPTGTTTYTVTGSNAIGCTATDNITVAVTACSSLLTKAGIVYNDLNDNGVKDPGEPGIPGKIIVQDPFPYYFSTNAMGEYQAYYDTGTYNLSLLQLSSFCNANPATLVLTGFSDTLNDFGLHCINVLDVQAAVITNIVRRGFQTTYFISYKNNGSIATNGDVYFKYDPALNYSSSYPTFSAQNNDTLVWAYSNLTEGESRLIAITFDVPLSTQLGDSVHTTVWITPIAGDTIPANNVYNISQCIVGSMDPNYKEVSSTILTPAQVLTQPDLYYTLHFQNTGNDTAINIVIKDSLCNKLIIPSIETISSSHPCIFSIEPNGTAVWTFNHIMLPDSNVDLDGSNGYIMFRIKTKNDIQVNDSINNEAKIYFDFNPAVVTNTATTIIKSPSIGINSTEAAFNSLLNVAPNPTNGILNISLYEQGSTSACIRIFNFSGQEVYSEKIANINGTFVATPDISLLPDGVYMVQGVTERGSKTQKILLIK